jgi:hypothetical protein
MINLGGLYGETYNDNAGNPMDSSYEQLRT